MQKVIDMKMVKVSVIIPVYNAGKYMKECLDSVISQTLKEIEVICIDDGSTDDSCNILMEYHEKYGNMVILRQENQGAGMARNKGIERANGKYICFMDADDFYAQNDVLECLYQHAEENHVSVCGGNLISVWENGKRKRASKWFSETEIISFKDYGNLYNYTNFIFDSKLIKENQITFPGYKRYEDPPFLLNVMIRAKDFCGVNKLVYAYRAGHKEISYSLETTIDILKGIRDCFIIAKNNDLSKTYEEYLRDILLNHFGAVYPYASQNNQEIWSLIGEINRISDEWTGETSEIFRDKKSLEAYVASIKHKRDEMVLKCHNAKEVVIYGAGEAGAYFLKHYGKECRNIAGFAVSRKGKEEFVKNYEIKEIETYKTESLIIVAAGRQLAEEMLQNLKRLGFRNVCYIEYSALQLLEKI